MRLADPGRSQFLILNPHMMNTADMLFPSCVTLWQTITDKRHKNTELSYKMLEIIKDENGSYNLAFVDSEGGESPQGEFHCLAAALAQAKLKFGVPTSAWSRVTGVFPY